MKVFDVKTKIRFGKDSLQYLTKIGGKRTFIVTDPFMVESGVINQITAYLEEGSYEIFSDIVPDSPIDIIAKGVTVISEFKPEVMIALGGGSAIDTAKAMMEFAKRAAGILDFKLIAIPTTSGTGSEATSFAVIKDEETGTKYPLVSDDLIPDVAILDPGLVLSVPDFLVAATGMDVLTHALEAYVSTDATDFTDALAQKAAELICKYLLRSYKDSNDLEAREKVHNASCIAGIAFNLTSLGINHSIAHVLGGKFNIPHGRTNAILLPHVIEFNAHIEGYNPQEYTIAAQKYAVLSQLLGHGRCNMRLGINNLVKEIIKLQQDMNMPLTLKDLNVDLELLRAEKEEIAELALQDICTKTNPRVATKQDIMAILDKIM